MKRRDFFKTVSVGAATIGVAGGTTLGWRAQGVGLFDKAGEAFTPWSALDGAAMGDPTALAAAAILAPSPHNTQPWRVSVSADALRVVADPERHLGAMDPFRRELWIGLGGAVANGEIAGRAFGFGVGAARLEGLDADGAGSVTLPLNIAPAGAVASERAQALAAAIPRRRTNRAAYATAYPEGRVGEALRLAGLDAPSLLERQSARLTLVGRDSADGVAFADATLSATRAIIADPGMSADRHHWFRATPRAVARHRDGVSIPTAGLSPAMTLLAQLAPAADAATSGAHWLRSTRAQLAASGGFGWITVADLDDRAGQIAAGRLWQRLHLAFTHAGVAAHPLNQLPEMVDRDRQLARAAGWRARAARLEGGAGRMTFGFRFGTPLHDVPHSARRPLKWVTV